MVRGSVDVTNVSGRDGSAVVQVYLDKQPGEKLSGGRNDGLSGLLDPDNQPVRSLCWFGRVQVPAGEKVTVSFALDRTAFETVLEDGSRRVLAGQYTLYAGGSQPDERSRELLGEEDWDKTEFYAG